MGTLCSCQQRSHYSEPIDKRSSPNRVACSQTSKKIHQIVSTSINNMYSPFRGLRRATSNSAGSLLVLPTHPGGSSNFSYPYPRTHTTLVVPPSAVQQRDRTPLFDDSPTSTTVYNVFGQTPSEHFRRPPLNRAIPPIPESKSNESIISQASQFTHRHSISGTSASISQKESIRVAAIAKEPLKPATNDNSVVIENRMAQNLGTRFATNMPSTISVTTPNPLPTTSAPRSLTEAVDVPTTKKTVAIITTRRVEEPTIPISKPTRLPLAMNKKGRSNRDTEPKSPLMLMAHSVRSRITKLGTRIGRATSRSPIRSSKSMVSIRRNTSNLDKSEVDQRLLKSTSEQPVARFEPPPPPTTSPPHDEDLDEQPVSKVVINSQRSVSQIPRRLPTTTLIPSPVGIYFRRLPEEDRLAICENEGPILAIDSKEALPTPDENQSPAPILLLRRISDELKEIPLENSPSVNAKRVNFRRHKHSHSFGDKLPSQVKTPKMTARLIVRQPSEPLYYRTHLRSKSRDAIAGMQTPKVALKQRGKTSTNQGNESVESTRSLKIFTCQTITPKLDEVEKTSPEPTTTSSKKSSSADPVCVAAKKHSLPTSSVTTENNQSRQKGTTTLCTSVSAGKADEMRLHKYSLIPRRLEPRTVKWVNKNKQAPLAIAEQTRVANSPAAELPPNSFEDADLRVRKSRLASPVRIRRMIFWRSKSKSTEEGANEAMKNDNNNNSRSMDRTAGEPATEEFHTVTTARITTKAPAISPTQATDSNGNNVPKTPKSEREVRLNRLTLNELLSSPLTSHKRIGNARALEAKQRSGLIDDEITDQPMLISTELRLLDNQTPTFGRDLNENSKIVMSAVGRDGDGNLLQQRTVRVRENDQSLSPVQYIASTTIQQQPQRHASATSQSKITANDHAQIEKIIENLSSQLLRIKEYAIEDEDELKQLRVENNSLREELQIKDQVIQLLMGRLKDTNAPIIPTTAVESGP